MKIAAITLTLVAVVGTPALAQVRYDSPAGRVEVLGLKRWTLTMLQDSMRKYVPGHELHDAACMVVLRDSLHFAEASVEQFIMAPPGKPVVKYLTIKVVEPEDAARVQWDVRHRNEFTSLLPDYAPLILPITDSVGGVWRGRVLDWFQYGDSASIAQAVARRGGKGVDDAKMVSAFLQRHRGEADRITALHTLRADGFWINRMVAAAVLGNFPQSDSTYTALVRALRDPHSGVREAADASLRKLPDRAVDWTSAANDLRLLIGGTNLPATTMVFSLLARTKVSPAMASSLLHDNAVWVLDMLGSETPMASPAAHGLLVQLNNGKDLGESRVSWDAWVKRL